MVSSFLDTLNEINQLLPAKLVIKECLKYGIKKIILRTYRIFDWIPGTYEATEIELDPEMDKEHLAWVLMFRHGIAIDPEDVPIWIFYHELGHHLKGKSEWEAERFAMEKYLEWKRVNRGN
ncbi:MAG: hypothetical protein NT096_01650 [Proteobacteria bacterium]|nr:hypothetical protein [Pseudomonadota bacterium]